MLTLALDFPDSQQAVAFIERLESGAGPSAGRARRLMLKVGSELFTAAGPDIVRNLVGRGYPVFLDLKFHDIPNTVARAVAAAGRLGVSLVNVHALGGVEMMRAAVEAAGEAAPGMHVIAVTMLTSHDDAEIGRIGLPGAAQEHVLRLAGLAAEAGLAGVVASPEETAALRARFPRPFLIVTPGIRPAWAPDRGDQKRVATPADAMEAGADYIVVGRPVTAAPDPADAVARILRELPRTPPAF